ncbi:hypothetical protein RFI_39282 [Reticulomyxa filosa]|uniref:Tf2-1-like SH3-like domain-containing protein n=1 Tax=Reticulomyxa filosa TaxID=46433 RepID=X6L9L5_RETFI|nr:hypothetical protein RFI_39282 [Reticulomyxa filosa]|eukprot:ETN98228.1 hypothetical protein RFI_39282 [Reticulomyxa filosa]
MLQSMFYLPNIKRKNIFKVWRNQHFPAIIPFQMVATGIVDHLPKTEDNYRYVMTMMDRFARYVEAVPLKIQLSKEIALTFVNKLIFRHFTLVIEKNLDFSQGDSWNSFIPAIVSSYNITPNRMILSSPHELVYGSRFILPIDIKMDHLRKNKIESQDMSVFKNILGKQLEYSTIPLYINRIRFENKNSRSHSFVIGDKVLLYVVDQRTGNNAKLQPKFVGPYEIIEQVGPSTVKIVSEKGFLKVIHVSKLKKFDAGTTNKEMKIETIYSSK